MLTISRLLLALTLLVLFPGTQAQGEESTSLGTDGFEATSTTSFVGTAMAKVMEWTDLLLAALGSPSASLVAIYVAAVLALLVVLKLIIVCCCTCPR